MIMSLNLLLVKYGRKTLALLPAPSLIMTEICLNQDLMIYFLLTSVKNYSATKTEWVYLFRTVNLIFLTVLPLDLINRRLKNISAWKKITITNGLTAEKSLYKNRGE